MHAPEKIEPTGLADYLAVMSRAALEPGLNWSVVESKWPGIVEAFDGFDAPRVAAYTPVDVDRLMGDPRVIRNRRKIEAIVHNAGEMLALETSDGGFRAYLRSFGTYEALVKDLRRRFKFLGDSGAYHFLYSVGEQVPQWEDWVGTHPGSRASRWTHRG
jgi:DNA-3-methyladenine glycosylase I